MMIVGACVASLLTKPALEVLVSWEFYLGLGTAYAWLALGVMTGAWVSNKRLAWHWPVFGGVVGMACAAAFAVMIPLYLPCAILGFYLCYFHLASRVHATENAA